MRENNTDIPITAKTKSALIGGQYKNRSYTGVFSQKDFDQVRKNIKKYSWAKDIFNNIKKDADYWATKSDEDLYNLIPSENPRAFCPCYSFGCPICGTGKDVQTYGTLITSLDTPNRWQCTTCGRWWGPDEEIEYKTEKGTIKFNIKDDGYGWRIPKGLPGYGHTCYFVAAYRLYILYTLLGIERGVNRSVITKGTSYQPRGAIGTMATVYAITGDTKYAHKTLLILNRLAQLYPMYDGLIDWGVGAQPRISYATMGEEEAIEACCYAYDIVFDYLPEDKELISFFEEKGQEDLDGDSKITHEDIRRNIAINLFGYMYDWLLCERKVTNNDWTVMEASHMALIGRTLENPDIVYEALEGKKGFRDLMLNLHYNDGRFCYDSLGYHFNAISYFGKVLFAVDGYSDGEIFKKPVNLFDDESIIFKHMINYGQGVICNERIPGIGDQVIPRERIDPTTIGKNPVLICSAPTPGMYLIDSKIGKDRFLILSTLIPKYPCLAHSIENKEIFIKRLMNMALKSQSQMAVELILKIPDIEKVVRKTHFESPTSRLFTDTGLGILRTNHKGIKRVHAMLNYGLSGYGHSHHNQLALNIIAYGYELTINKGYPFTWAESSTKVFEWLFDTKAQNTVRINGQNQTRCSLETPVKEYMGELHTYQDNDLVGIVDGSCEKAYPGLAEMYRRTIFLIKDKKHPFVVDIFNVTGGDVRDYQFHAQSDIEGKNFEINWDDATDLAPAKKTPQYIDSRFMYDIKRANVKDSFTARWWIGDKYGTGLVLHMLKGQTSRTIITAKGQAEGGDKPLPCDSHLIVREKGAGRSQFVSVVFPYHDSVPEYKIEKLEQTGCKAEDKIVALRITLGKKAYVIFHDLEGKAERVISMDKHTYAFSGIAGVISEKNGEVEEISLSRGNLLGRDAAILESGETLDGRIISINELEKSIIVGDISIPCRLPSLLKWRNKPWVYRVLKAEKKGNRTKMYLDTFSFKDRGAEPYIQAGDRVFFINELYGKRLDSNHWKIERNLRKEGKENENHQS